MISVSQPCLHISNFSDIPIRVATGQILGCTRNPQNWLDRKAALSGSAMTQALTHANFIQQLSESLPLQEGMYAIWSKTETSSKAQRNTTKKDDLLAEAPIEGSPKTSLSPEDDVESAKLLKAVNISTDLSTDQRG